MHNDNCTAFDCTEFIFVVIDNESMAAKIGPRWNFDENTKISAKIQAAKWYIFYFLCKFTFA